MNNCNTRRDKSSDLGHLDVQNRKNRALLPSFPLTPPLTKRVICYDPSFFWWKISELAAKRTTPPLIAAISTFFHAIRFLSKIQKTCYFSKRKLIFHQNKWWISLKKVLKKMHKKCLLYFLADLWMLIIMFILKIVFCCATLANASWQYTLKSPYKKVKGFLCILKNKKTWKKRHFPPYGIIDWSERNGRWQMANGKWLFNFSERQPW